MNVIKFELSHCLKRKEFHFAFTLALLISMTAFIMECMAFYGSNLTYVRSSAESSIIQGTYSNTVRTTLIVMLPIISSIIYADSFYTDFKSGIYQQIVTRVSKSKFIITRAFVIFVMTFGSLFLALMVNVLLCMIAFPEKGFDNVYSLPPYDLGVQNYHDDYFLDLFRIQAPFLFNITHLLIISIFAGLLGLVSFAIYFYFLNKSRIYGMMITFIGFIVLNVFFSSMGYFRLSLMTQLQPVHVGTILELVSWGVSLFILSCVIIYTKGIRSEWDLM